MIVLPATGEGTVKTHEWTRCSQSASSTGGNRYLAAYMSMGKAPREKYEAYLAPLCRMKGIMGPLCFPGHQAAKSLEQGTALGRVCQQGRDVRTTRVVCCFLEEAVWSCGRARRAVGGCGHGSGSGIRRDSARPCHKAGVFFPTLAMPESAVLRLSVCC